MNSLWAKYPDFSPDIFQRVISSNSQKRRNAALSKISFSKYSDFMQDCFQEVIANELQKETGQLSQPSLRMFREYLRYYYLVAILTDKSSKVKESHASSLELSDASCSSLVRLLSRWMAALLSYSSSNMHESVPSTVIIVLAFLLRVSYRLKSIKLIEPLLVRLDSTFPALTASPCSILGVATWTSPLDCLVYLYFRGKIFSNDSRSWALALNAFDASLKLLRVSKKQPKPSYIERRVFIYMTTLRYLLNQSPPVQAALAYYNMAELADFFVRRSSWIPPIILLEFDTLYFTCMVEAKFRFILSVLKKWRNIEGDSFTYRISYEQLFDLLQKMFGSLGAQGAGGGFVNSTVELEALLAKMIHAGSIKGYLSHEKATMVLSKKNPFPTA